MEPAVTVLFALPFQLCGEIDLATALVWRDRLGRHIDATPGASVVIDCDALAFIDSSGIGVLVDARRRLAAGRSLRIVNLHDPGRRAVEILGLVEFLGVAEPTGTAPPP
jgi:anti-anti-sigma factor